mmetsp:Transcript_46794/g.73250  ORF Transcript_46794/g.73250 Transcript_46794/m.73250 type:complete len:156 (-) Transcript_46794:338-805(-)|eukprot:CAMPEP_0184307606 /NCGR_PEP_ID=MMETSP1049-20130417/16320_1 /TAXON_ID=77928 /ORGANISM="Proteomonas sulcata, Strain CCMP704" /LENGTH=155 /DNA_ID=CAMNT_0026620131 /DNA_START=140 /DNA_END=607 /DNA_ORIENTATION=+
MAIGCLSPKSSTPSEAISESWAQEVVEYAVGLGEATDKNIGLDHSKVREYWLLRGPRLAWTAVIFFTFSLVCQELLKKNLATDRLYMVVVSVVALMIALYMLYWRLPDAIEGSVLRAAHDYYKGWKSGYETKTPKPKPIYPGNADPRMFSPEPKP